MSTRRSHARVEVLWLLVALALAFAAHAPSLRLGFVSDDFQWWQRAQMALVRPATVLEPFGGWRPINTCALALDATLFGQEPIGYHGVSVALHLACGLLFWLLLNRLELGPRWAAAVVFLWLTSPYTLEPAQSVTTRLYLVLFLSWLGLALVWPGPGQSWSRRRGAAAVALSLLTALTIETWVVLPGFTFAFDLCLAGRRLRSALGRSLLYALGPLAYVIAYFFIFPSPVDPSSYFAGPAAASKVPHAWAAFSGWTVLYPIAIPFRAIEVAALAAIAVAAIYAWRRRERLAGLGFAFFLLPFLPILPVGFLATRYTAIPFCGFLIVAASLLRSVQQSAAVGLKRLVAVASAVVFLAIASSNLTTLRADMDDARRLHEVYAGLLDEAQAFRASFPRDRLVVVVRDENQNPMLDLARHQRGMPKLYYPRHGSPYALADWAALWSYVLAPEGPLLVDVQTTPAPESPFAVVAHRVGGFALLPAETSSAEREAEVRAARGERVRILAPWP